ncbi:MAG: S1 RNA-binding domain-containing protein, partial [Chloroflexi bacterium]|nr:S1 RNA-binding domain-containing protein [Chloroflexota bacterium]
AVLTDIEGVEDAWGDMDFKVAGTVVGITALQMDIKSRGVSVEIMGEALSQARVARLQILEKMQQTISASRPELSRYAPRMVKITVPVDKIRYVIGPGGRVIRSITDETKVTLEVQNDGTIILGSPNEDAIKKAIAIIESLTRDVEVGTIYTGKVTRVTNFGAFVEILPDKEGLVHISELAEHRVERVEDVVKVGDEIQVMVIEIDRQGRVNLSHRAIHKGLEATLAEPRRSVIEPSGPRRLDSRPRRYPGDRFPSPTERRPMPPRRPLGPR